MAEIIKFMLNQRVSVNPDKEFIPFILVFGHFRLRRNKRQTAVMNTRKYKSISGKK